MDRKLFVISDIHGYYDEMRAALDEAGFDPGDPTHVLLSLGDLFDRGPDSGKVYRYVTMLPRKILLCGNHEQRLLQIMHDRYVQSYDLRNGTVNTLHHFFGRDCVGNGGIFMTPTDDPTYREIEEYLQSLLPYYEWGDYVFTHAWLPIDNEVPPHLLPDWRNATIQQWHKAYWLEWQQLYNTEAKPEGKILVCGHRSANLGYFFDYSRAEYDYSTFFGDGVIVLDANTYSSRVVNVLVLSSSYASQAIRH